MNDVLKKRIFHYTAFFDPDKKEGGYTVTVPVLPGCISEGDTFEEALSNITEAASLYLEGMREKHQEIPQEEGVIVAPVQVRA